MTRRPSIWVFTALLASSALAFPLFAQSPSGPIAPQAGIAVQQAPQPRIGVRVALVNTPVTVRDSKGQMVHTLDAKDFHGYPRDGVGFNCTADQAYCHR